MKINNTNAQIELAKIENLKSQPQPIKEDVTQNFSKLLDDQVSLQNGGGGHPDGKKKEN
ncbi:hypothetical protein MHM95_06040 [Pseudoalteromonas sp. CnMc7-15]|uniref:hypothetical protein n=1 Tax=Pseudoalteromonas TaxID=53246 RepID=UPI00034B772F|nr:MULTISPECIES: hypothetical protein [Pseudoalteromonas]MCG7565847.1 hypothetical protein [Pseudoalteromonas sp. CnMc7-15]